MTHTPTKCHRRGLTRPRLDCTRPQRQTQLRRGCPPGVKRALATLWPRMRSSTRIPVLRGCDHSLRTHSPPRTLLSRQCHQEQCWQLRRVGQVTNSLRSSRYLLLLLLLLSLAPLHLLLLLLLLLLVAPLCLGFGALVLLLVLARGIGVATAGGQRSSHRRGGSDGSEAAMGRITLTLLIAAGHRGDRQIIVVAFGVHPGLLCPLTVLSELGARVRIRACIASAGPALLLPGF
mmetsp:Transcript_8520/g.26414  ORF Transcript_8520/g.26414 Transcript_8520/m.26414 type:complete len:233 (+) Transcript_8520:317-1015(+)